MSFDQFKNAFNNLLQRGSQALQGLDQRAHGWLGLLARAGSAALNPGSAITAAAIAYFALFSIFPLILASVAIASLPLGAFLSEQFILGHIEFIAPALGQLLGPNIGQIIRLRGAVTVAALLGLVWSGSTVFNMLNQTMSDLWGYKRVRPLWKRRGLAILVVLAITGPLLIFASFGSSLLATLFSLLPLKSPALLQVTGLLVALILNIALFELLYVIFPHGRATWQQLLAGSIAAGILWEAAKQAFLAFVSSYVSAYNLVYGSVAAIIAFLTWAYLSGLIFLFGAYTNLYYHQRLQQTNDDKAGGR